MMKKSAAASNDQKTKDLLEQQVKKEENKFKGQRKFERHTCFAVGVMKILDRSLAIEGVINEISVGGLRFRPATTYLLNRKDDRVNVIIDDIVLPGSIRATRPDGYGIALHKKLTDDELQYIVENYKEAKI